jgi:hypothetical protein
LGSDDGTETDPFEPFSVLKKAIKFFSHKLAQHWHFNYGSLLCLLSIGLEIGAFGS